MIFRLRIVRDVLDLKRSEIGAQARQRPLVEKAGQVVGGIGQELAAAETDEQVEIFALDFRGDRTGRSFSKRRMRVPKRRRIAGHG